jgi:molybdopterin/thiamine biosynthesis adenylyltransferase
LKTILNPQTKLFWTPSEESPKAIVAALGKERQVYTCLSLRDIRDLKKIAGGNNRMDPKSKIGNWLVQHKFAFTSNDFVLPDYFNQWSRQISFYTNFTTFENALKVQEKIFGLTFLIIGIGGIGCNMILQLQNIGVKNFILVDDDRVELSNLNRQVLFGRKDIGKPKVLVAAEKIRLKDPQANVQAIQENALGENLLSLLPQQTNFAIISADTPSLLIRKRFSQFFFSRKIPYAFLSYFGSNASIGPVVFSDADGCGCCTVNSIDFSNEIEQVSGHNIFNIAPSSGSTNSFISSFFTNELIKQLCGIKQENGNWLYNLLTNEINFTTFKKFRSCHVCGTTRH